MWSRDLLQVLFPFHEIESVGRTSGSSIRISETIERERKPRCALTTNLFAHSLPNIYCREQ
jgi:hypothetical protein